MVFGVVVVALLRHLSGVISSIYYWRVLSMHVPVILYKENSFKIFRN